MTPAEARLNCWIDLADLAGIWETESVKKIFVDLAGIELEPSCMGGAGLRQRIGSAPGCSAPGFRRLIEP